MSDASKEPTTSRTNPEPRLPVAVIGAGPIGLVAAAHLVSKGETPLVFEAGTTVAASIHEWAHVRLFTPWKYLIDPLSQGLLQARGWKAPNADRLPSGGELIQDYLEPLAALPEIAPHLRLGHRVIAVTRRGMDKVKTAGRESAPFELVISRPDGSVTRQFARAVIDASGTWRSPNPLGSSGLLASGETENRDHIRYGIPDVLGRERARYAGRRTLVVGSGHSAFNTVVDLAALSQRSPGTKVLWAVRRNEIGLLFGGGRRDALEARGALGSKLQRMVATKQVEFLPGFRVDQVADGSGRLLVRSEDGRMVEGLDQLIVTTGFRPDLALTRELRLKLDPWLEAPESLAPLIDPNLHSCGTVYPHGAAELAHPEKSFYVVGMKSYGRAPTFLLLTGYEQVRSVVCALVGDEEGARNVELVLPETGVCQTDFDAGSCCGSSEELVDEDWIGAGKVEVAPTAGGCGCGTAPSGKRTLTTISRCCA